MSTEYHSKADAIFNLKRVTLDGLYIHRIRQLLSITQFTMAKKERIFSFPSLQLPEFWLL